MSPPFICAKMVVSNQTLFLACREETKEEAEEAEEAAVEKSGERRTVGGIST